MNTLHHARSEIHDRPSEKGATAILVAGTMALLVGVAAVAIDLGSGFNESTQAQSAVDAGVLAAVYEAVGANAAAAVTAGEAVARDYVARNLPGRSLNWATCVDPSRPPEFTRWLASNPCVSFTVNFEKARVVLPDDDVKTTFGRLLGAAFITVRELAEAGQKNVSSAQVVPFVPNSSSPHNCLYSNQASQTIPPCDGPSNGNFGYLDIALHGNTDSGWGTPPTCEQGTANTRIAINLAKGSDHNMAKWAAPNRNDHTICPNRSVDVNELEVKTGSPGSGITDGLITGISGNINGQPFTASPGRFRCVGAPTCPTGGTSVKGLLLDDTPLWYFLSDDWINDDGNNPPTPGNFNGVLDPGEAWVLSLPNACRFPDGVGNPGRKPATTVEMDACLAAWNTSHSPMFKKALQDHKRFIATPVFLAYPTTGSAASYRIIDFAPIFLRTIYMGCNANRCTTIFTPDGVSGLPSDTAACPNPINATALNCGHSAGGSTAVEGLTGSLLKVEMLHPDTANTFPGTQNTRTTNLSK